MLRSTATLLRLYALLGGALIAAVEFGGLDLEFAVGAGVAIVVLQFLIGPFLMAMSLRWLYRMDWVEPGQLPEHLRRFVERVSGEQGIRFPRFGIINDGAPQAFTYGHTPNNARVVISRGILELLYADEVEAVVAHEIGHALHWDMFLMTVVQLRAAPVSITSTAPSSAYAAGAATRAQAHASPSPSVLTSSTSSASTWCCGSRAPASTTPTVSPAR